MTKLFLRVFVAALPAFFSVCAAGEEIRVGHLKTHDDTGVNWLYLHCNRSARTLECDTLQTIIYHELEPANRDAEVERLMKGDSVANFRKDFGAVCQNIDSVLGQVMAAAATGRGPDGRVITQSAARNGVALFQAIKHACVNTTPITVRHVLEITADQKLKSCKIYHDYSNSKPMDCLWA